MLTVLTLAIVLSVGLAAPAAAVPSRSFDTNGDGIVELTIFDTNGDGYFEWPTGIYTFPGRLEFTATDRIAFSGTVTINTGNGLFYAAGSQLVSRPGAPLQRLVVTANRGDVGGFGLLDLAPTGDVSVTAYTYLFLFGQTRIATPGTISLLSKTAGVLVAQPHPDVVAPGAFALLAGTQLKLLAKGNASSILVEQARVGGRVVNISTTSSSSNPRFFLLRNNSVVTTNPVRTGLAGWNGNVTLGHENGSIAIRGSTVVDSGKDVVLKTPYNPGTACVSSNSAIVARGGAGTIDTRLVTNAVRDATSAVIGFVLGKPFILGNC
jgi:hypothetical protein